MRRDRLSTSAGSRRISFFALPVLALLALLSWGLSSAVGSSPDDDFHLASIWCGHGDSPECARAPVANDRIVYRDLVVDSVCFAFKPESSASCHGPDFGQNPRDTAETARGNFTGLYPPVFYFVMSWLAGPDIEVSVLSMKLLNSVIFVGLVAGLWWLLPQRRRPTLFWGLALSMVPLGMFIVPSTNPSSWAVLSAGTLWIAVVGYFESAGRRKYGLAAIAAASGLIGAGARADAAVYAGMAIAIAVLLTFRVQRQYLISLILPALLVCGAILFFFSASQGNSISSGLAPSVDGRQESPVVLALVNLVNVPGLWAGAFGSWGLGWLDTELPAGVWVAGLGCFFAAILWGIGIRAPRKGLAVGLIVAALWLIPTVLLVQSRSVVGENVQPRYILPLLILLVGVALLAGPTTGWRVTASQRWVVVIALSLANSVALHTNIRRYVTGLDGASVNLDVATEWWWKLPISPMTVWVIGSLAFAATLVVASRLLGRTGHEALDREVESRAVPAT